MNYEDADLWEQEKIQISQQKTLIVENKGEKELI